MKRSLVYRSSALETFSEEDLDLLASKAGVKNHRLGITGYLYHNRGVFFQYLEGGTGELDELMAAISSDERHKVEFVLNLEWTEQIFPKWSMRRLKSNEIREVGMEMVLDSTIQTMAIEGSFTEKERTDMVHRLCRQIARLQS